MKRMAFEAFWDAANNVLVYRGQPQMLFGEARDAYGVYIDDWKARGQPGIVED